MKNNALLSLIIIAVVVALIVVISLKAMGYSNATVTGGAIAGGVTGAFAGSYFKKNKS